MPLKQGARYEKVINDLIVFKNHRDDYALSFVDEFGDISPSFFTFEITPIVDPVGDYDQMIAKTKYFEEIIDKPDLTDSELEFIENFDKLTEDSHNWLLVHAEEFERLGLSFNLQQSEVIFESAFELGFKFGSQTILYWLYNRIAKAIESLNSGVVKEGFGSFAGNELKRNSDLSEFIDSTIIDDSSNVTVLVQEAS